LAAFLATLLTGSLFACGSNGGGYNAGSNGRNPLAGDLKSSMMSSDNPLVGTWVSGEYSLTFRSDNTYLADSSGDGNPAVWGRVMISGNVAIFSGASGSNSSSRLDGGQIISGTYTYTIYGTTLTFSPVLDLCRDPANILCLSYQKR